MRAEVDVRADAAVVGGGVVGLAIAHAIAEGGRSVVLCERHARIGTETSSRNSEVIHAGLYYPPGSLKAELCIAGRERLYSLCASAGIAHRRVGKLIVATDASAVEGLARIHRNAEACGVRDLVAIDGAEVERLEPRVRGAAGLLSPATGIVDAHGVMAWYAAQIRDAGGAIAARTTVDRVEPDGDALRLIARGPDGPVTIGAPAAVLAAGIDGDRLLRACGVGADVVPDHVLVKGEYFALRRAPVSRLVYPVPPPQAAGLGVHVTLDLAGEARLGPNTVPLARTDVDRAGAYDVDPSHASAFLAAARAYLPDLEGDDLRPAYAGIRPRLVAAGFADFVIRDLSAHGLPGAIALAGIESPGLTAAPAIAERVASMLAPRFT